LQRLLQGVGKFRREVYPNQREVYERAVRDGQHPHTLMLACADSRIDPILLTQSDPGEIFVLGENPRWNSRVLASLDMESVGADTEPAGPERNDYPISWIREQDGGRVFVTKLGHFPEVWRNPAYLRHVLQGLRMVSGRIAADFSGHRAKDVLVENVWPDDIAVDDRGNVWIVELRGKIFYYDAETEQSRQLGELPTTDPTNIEHGIYGIEVDPNFYDGEPYVYIYYAEPQTFINTLSRFEFRNGQLDFASERVLLRVPTEPQCCHQAGDLEWGPDGTLYISTGDTGYSGTRPEWEISEDRIAAFREKHNLTDFHWSRLVDSERTAQNLTDLRGKILRINKDGTIPKDNPFYGQAGVRWEIYAYGLRNPYRFKVDPQTGTLYIGVVGPDAIYDYDEYNVSANGGENFGWPRSIGSIFYNEWTPDMIPNYTPPMWDYTYETGGRSATVGPLYQYEGAGAFPATFQGKLFVYDWSRRWIKWVDIEDGTYTNNPEGEVKATASNVSIPAKRFANARLFDQLTLTTPISMELGPDGALYVAEFDGFWEAGPNARVTRYRWVTGEE
jgi:glucose/arabinose dehydrogenase